MEKGEGSINHHNYAYSTLTHPIQAYRLTR